MANVSVFQKVTRLAGAFLIAGALFGSATASPTFAEKKSSLPDGTKCERVSVNFTTCTTPDGTVYWCTDDGTCEKAPRIVVTTGLHDVTATGGLLINPGDDAGPRFPKPIGGVRELTRLP